MKGIINYKCFISYPINEYNISFDGLCRQYVYFLRGAGIRIQYINKVSFEILRFFFCVCFYNIIKSRVYLSVDRDNKTVPIVL